MYRSTNLNSFFDNILKHSDCVFIFDVDNTITKSNIIYFYTFLIESKIRNKFFASLWKFLFLIITGPIFLILDLFDRSKVQKIVYTLISIHKFSHIESTAEIYFDKYLKQNFIIEIHDLIHNLKTKGANIFLLSTNIDLIIKQYAKYFDVKYFAIETSESTNGCIINMRSLKSFKLEKLHQFNSNCLIGIADSKHDIIFLNNVDFPFVVGKKMKNWIYKNSFNLIVKDKIFYKLNTF
jgi:phosphoserine phosphatase